MDFVHHDMTYTLHFLLTVGLDLQELETNQHLREGIHP